MSPNSFQDGRCVHGRDQHGPDGPRPADQRPEQAEHDRLHRMLLRLEAVRHARELRPDDDQQTRRSFETLPLNDAGIDDNNDIGDDRLKWN